MTDAQVTALARGMAPVVRELIAAATAPLLSRIDALERRSTDGLPERLAVLEHRMTASEETARVPGPKGDPGQNGTSVSEADVERMLRAEVRRAIDALPAPKEGQPGKPGEPGKSVTIDEVAPLIQAEVQRAVAAQPPPAVPSADEVRTLVVDEVAKAVAAVPVPKDGQDGIGLAGAFIGREGQLVVTLSDGSTRELGPVVGRDADLEAIRHAIADEVAKIPRPKDGVDGLGFDDLEVVKSDDRTITVIFTKGERQKRFDLPFPAVIYRGLYDDGREYVRGDQVTYGGSQWTANETCQGIKPDEHMPMSVRVWTLSAKRGREGKQGLKGDKGDPGLKGDKGDTRW